MRASKLKQVKTTTATTTMKRKEKERIKLKLIKTHQTLIRSLVVIIIIVVAVISKSSKVFRSLFSSRLHRPETEAEV